MSTEIRTKPEDVTQEYFDKALADHQENLRHARVVLAEAEDAADEAARDVTAALHDKVNFLAAVRQHCSQITIPDGADR